MRAEQPTGEAGPSSAPPRTIRNAGATLVARGIGQLARLCAILVMTAYLSADQWGVFSLLASGLDLARGLTNFGLDPAGVRRMAVHPEAEGGILRLILRLKTGLALAGLCGLTVYTVRTAGPSPAAFILPLALFPLGWAASLTARFQVRHAMHWLIPVQAGVGALYLVIVLIAARMGVKITGFVILLVGVEAISCLATGLMGRRIWRQPALPTSTTVPFSAMAFVREGLPLGALDITVNVYMRMGVFLVKSVGGGDAAAGHLYTALKVNEYVVGIAGALAASALPVFSRMAHSGRIQDVKRTFLKYSLFGAALSVSAAVVLTLFGGLLLSFRNPANIAAAASLAILTWAGVAMFQNNISSTVLYAFGQFKRAAICAVTATISYFFVASWFVPRYGARGAALSMVLTEGMAALGYLGLVVVLLRGRLSQAPPPATEPMPELPSEARFET